MLEGGGVQCTAKQHGTLSNNIYIYNSLVLLEIQFNVLEDQSARLLAAGGRSRLQRPQSTMHFGDSVSVCVHTCICRRNSVSLSVCMHVSASVSGCACMCICCGLGFKGWELGVGVLQMPGV